MAIQINQQLMPESDKRLLLELFRSRTFIVLLNHLANKRDEIAVMGANLELNGDPVDSEDSKEHFETAKRFGQAIAILTEVSGDNYKFQTSTFDTEPITIETPQP